MGDRAGGENGFNLLVDSLLSPRRRRIQEVFFGRNESQWNLLRIKINKGSKKTMAEACIGPEGANAGDPV